MAENKLEEHQEWLRSLTEKDRNFIARYGESRWRQYKQIEETLTKIEPTQPTPKQKLLAWVDLVMAIIEQFYETLHMMQEKVNDIIELEKLLKTKVVTSKSVSKVIYPDGREAYLIESDDNE